MSKSEAPLLLLGNDLFRDHLGYRKEGLIRTEFGMCVRLRDKNRHILVDVPCVSEPYATHGNRYVPPTV